MIAMTAEILRTGRTPPWSANRRLRRSVSTPRTFRRKGEAQAQVLSW